MFHLVRETSLFRATMMFRDSAKVSLTRESCARNDVNVSTMLFTVCPCSENVMNMMEESKKRKRG
jgi:GTP cyclohydrolase FolE2